MDDIGHTCNNSFVKRAMTRTPDQALTTASNAPTIRRREGVLGGAACIRDTRIPVSVLVDLRAQGRSDKQLLGDFPGLTKPDLDAAWTYYRDHQSEIDQWIAAEAGEK